MAQGKSDLILQAFVTALVSWHTQFNKFGWFYLLFFWQFIRNSYDALGIFFSYRQFFV